MNYQEPTTERDYWYRDVLAMKKYAKEEVKKENEERERHLKYIEKFIDKMGIFHFNSEFCLNLDTKYSVAGSMLKAEIENLYFEIKNYEKRKKLQNTT